MRSVISLSADSEPSKSYPTFFLASKWARTFYQLIQPILPKFHWIRKDYQR